MFPDSGVPSSEYPCSLPPEVEREKIRNLKQFFADRLNYDTVWYRAARYGADYETMQFLKGLGFRYDSSVTPQLNWQKQGGPDHSTAPLEPYWIGQNDYYGIGTGYYVPQFLEKKAVIVGVDMHPELCPYPFEVLKVDATSFAGNFRERKFDTVFSSWMSEYLSLQQLAVFIQECYTVLEPGGRLIFTTIPPKGWGWLYIWAAKLKGIQKYNHSASDVKQCLDKIGFQNIEMTPLNSQVSIPWAHLFVA